MSKKISWYLNVGNDSTMEKVTKNKNVFFFKLLNQNINLISSVYKTKQKTIIYLSKEDYKIVSKLAKQKSPHYSIDLYYQSTQFCLVQIKEISEGKKYGFDLRNEELKQMKVYSETNLIEDKPEIKSVKFVHNNEFFFSLPSITE